MAKLSGAEWTILVYMAADNGLHNNALDDIAEMELSQFSSNANIIVQMDGDSNSQLPGTYRYKISPNSEDGIQSSVMANLGEQDSGSYLTLKSFVEWGFQRYNSNKKALIIWSHGSGWYKQEIRGKGIAPDNSTMNFISMSDHELQKALKYIELDLLIYDACNMQTIENLVELKGVADYIIGSVATVPTTGLPYTQIFDYWLQTPNLDSLVVNIPKIYVDAYRPGNIYNQGSNLPQATFSTAKMDNLDTFETALNEYLFKWSVYPEEFRGVRQEINEFGVSYTDIDLKELLEALEQKSGNEELVNDSKVLYQSLEDLFISYDSSSFNYKVGTASLWFPLYTHQFSNNWPYYRNLDFAQAEIGNFLNKFLGPDEISPFPLEITKSLVLNETIYLEWENHNDPDPLTYHIHFTFADKSRQVITLQDTGVYEGRVEQGGEIYIIAEDASENRTSSNVVEFTLSSAYGKVYLAPNPVRHGSEAKIIVYDQGIGGKQAQIGIYTISGRELATKTLMLAEGQDENKIKLADIIPDDTVSGIYICSVKIDGKYYKTKFAIEN